MLLRTRLGMVMIQSINGAGDTSTPVWLNVIAFWMVEIPLAYIFTNVFGLEVKGVAYAILIAETLLTLLAVYVFWRGKWKLTKV